MGKIVVIGSSNVDMIMKMDRLPQLGETVTDAEYTQVFGGKGANQAVGAARAGGDVTFITCVGNDPLAETMVQNFKKDGIDTKNIFIEKDVPSGAALVMIGGQGDNYLSVAPGANYRLDRNKIDQVEAALEKAEIIVMQYEIPADTIEYVMNKAAAANKPVMWNCAPARYFNRDYLAKIDYLIVNETEAAFLADIKADELANIEETAQKLLKLGSKTVVITLGGKGSYVTNQRGDAFSVAAYPVQAIDTTAAGDVYCGALAVALVEQKPIKEAVKFASAAAAMAVTKLGAQPSAPFRQDIEGLMK
jgi:ribokinase